MHNFVLVLWLYGSNFAPTVTQQVAEYIQRLRDENKQHIVLDYDLAKSLTDVN
jgi:hypothetical protein